MYNFEIKLNKKFCLGPRCSQWTSGLIEMQFQIQNQSSEFLCSREVILKSILLFCDRKTQYRKLIIKPY